MTVEEAIESLEGIDLEGVPRCEIYIAVTDYNDQCGNPSVARVAYTCRDCAWRNRIFICRECLADLADNGVMCLWCKGDLVWKYI